MYLYFQNQSPSLRFPQFALCICIFSLQVTLSICIDFRTSLPASDSLSLHCLFVLFSEPVSQPQIPSVCTVYLYFQPSSYTVYLYCFQNQSPSLRFPQFTLSICIVFRTSLPASDSLSLNYVFVLFSEPVSQPQIPSVYTVYLYCFQNQSTSLRFPQFALCICIFRTSLPASDSFSLNCLFVFFSEPVAKPQIPSVYTVYLYCFQNQSPSLRFPQFTLSICIVFRTSLPASDSLSLNYVFVFFSEPVSQPQIPSVYTVYLYCFQNQSTSLRFPQLTLSICIVFRTSPPASDSPSQHCLFVLFSEPASQPQIPSVYTVYLYCFQNQ